MSKSGSPTEQKPLFHIPRTRAEWAAEGREWIKSILIVLVVFLPLVTFVVQGFRIPSSSMEDTLLIGDFLFADKITFGARVPLTRDARLPGMRLPKPGDIVIFKSPQSGENLIKRCVAVAGQSVEVRDKILYVDGARRDEAFTKHIDRYVRASRDNFGPLVVPAGNIFCMGDNRDASHDSRFFGPVPLRLVIAKADVLYFSFNVKKFLPRINRIGKML
jgi:signal peptidase I